jgi:hypothetical protein
VQEEFSWCSSVPMRKDDSAWPNIGCAEARCDHKISLLDQRRHRASFNDEQA